MIGGFLPVETGKILVEGKPVAGPGPDRASCCSTSRCSPEDRAGQHPLRARTARTSRNEREKRAQASIDLAARPGDRLPSTRIFPVSTGRKPPIM